MMNLKAHKILGILGVLALLAAAPSVEAASPEFTVRGHVGGLGVGSYSGIGYGGAITLVPDGGWAGFILDATFASLGVPAGQDSFYFSSSPSLVAWAYNSPELRFGALAGGGFYKVGAQSVRFGLDVGGLAEFALTDVIAVGADMRYHPIFNSDDAWNVFLTLNFTFQGRGGGW